jgi:hypothetical protein
MKVEGFSTMGSDYRMQDQVYTAFLMTQMQVLDIKLTHPGVFFLSDYSRPAASGIFLSPKPTPCI